MCNQGACTAFPVFADVQPTKGTGGKQVTRAGRAGHLAPMQAVARDIVTKGHGNQGAPGLAAGGGKGHGNQGAPGLAAGGGKGHGNQGARTWSRCRRCW